MTTARVRPASGLNLREKPNGRVLEVLQPDEEVSVIETVTFHRVKTRAGVIGYVHGDFVEEIPSGPETEIASAVFSESFPDPAFELVHFSGEQFIGERVMVDRDFLAALQRVDDYARLCSVKVWVTSSTRNLNQQVRGAIVTPATRSCHHIGHAIDMNVHHNGILYNSKKLKKSVLDQQPEPVGRFINMIRDDEKLRWGGDFNKEDPVHIDDDMYHRNETFYLSKLHSRIAQLNV